jgi:hypothetical protein
VEGNFGCALDQLGRQGIRRWVRSGGVARSYGVVIGRVADVENDT